MKERPILFTAPMVRALLDGRKTQTRRAVRFDDSRGRWNADGYSSVTPDAIVKVPWTAQNIQHVIPCPYGQPGDRLWVRETYNGPFFDQDAEVPDDAHTPKYCIYRADGDQAPEYVDADDNLVSGWRPSIFMPRWASRITLEIVSARVERLRDISEADAKAEGVESITKSNFRLWRDYCYDDHWFTEALPHTGSSLSYRTLWESINKPGSWAKNPWVWVINFKMATP